MPAVTRAGEWDVSDNGENVVAFHNAGTQRDQADFGWGYVGKSDEVVALITSLGSAEFLKRVHQLKNASGLMSHTFTVAEFGDPA